jgi:hypothetical protein
VACLLAASVYAGGLHAGVGGGLGDVGGVRPHGVLEDQQQQEIASGAASVISTDADPRSRPRTLIG